MSILDFQAVMLLLLASLSDGGERAMRELTDVPILVSSCPPLAP
jgi:hypothetical protein